MADEPIPLPGPPLGDLAGFRLLRQLGPPGSFGTVYEAVRDGDRYALKVFHAPLLTEEQEERFRREVATLKQASHLNVVPYADSGVASFLGRRLPWIAMPYIEGRSLLDELRSGGGLLPAARVRHIGRQIATGLGALHDLNIVHRDLKPANVLVGDDDVVRLLDFGVARFLDRTTITSHGDLKGSPAYSSPEQLRGEAEHPTDLWALGVVIYELLTGRRPFVAEDLGELVDAIRSEQPEAPSAHRPEIPDDLDQLILGLLEKDPMQRPASAGDVADLLRPNVQAAPPQVEPLADGTPPLVFLRVGNRDVNSALNACLGGDCPTGIVASPTEPTAVREGRKAAQMHELGFGVDPQLWRMARSSFAATKSLRALDYSPDGLSPWHPDDLRSQQASQALARKVVGAQVEWGSNLLFSASFSFAGLDDPWLKRNAALLGDSLRARDAHGPHRHLFAPIMGTFEPLTSEEALLAVANRLSRGRPDGYWLLLDGVKPPGTVAHLLFPVRLARLLQERLGVPVVIGRAGSLRHVFLACGVGGVEVGLGRLVGFRLSDHDGSNRRVGYSPAQWEMPSLLCSLSQEKARGILESGELDESTCACRVCQDGDVSLDARFEATPEHNAAILRMEREELAGMLVAERIERLRAGIERAQALGRRLRARKLLTDGDLVHLNIWRQALDVVSESGLLLPGQAARRLAG